MSRRRRERRDARLRELRGEVGAVVVGEPPPEYLAEAEARALRTTARALTTGEPPPSATTTPTSRVLVVGGHRTMMLAALVAAGSLATGGRP